MYSCIATLAGGAAKLAQAEMCLRERNAHYGVDEAKSKQQCHVVGERVFVNILFRWSWTHRYISAWAIDAWNIL